MSQLTNSSSWEATENQTKLKQTYTFSTRNSYNNKDITLEINVPGIHLENSKTFWINDGIYTWNWEIDSNGNVLIY